MLELKSSLHRLRKLRTLTTLPDITGRRKRKKGVFPSLPDGLNEVFDTTDDLESKLAHALHDDQLARRVVSLKDKDPYGTVIELIVLDFLQSVGERYTYQAELYGGFRAGGVVPDFVVSRSGNGLALLINGTFWHRPDGPQNDAADKLRITGSYFNGDLITNTVILWETRVMAPDRRSTMIAALGGQELPA